jgi:hypothetical protein
LIKKLLAFTILLFSLSASAQSGEVVLLLRPATTSGDLQEAFNRLKGELSLHGFQVIVIEVDDSFDAAALEEQADIHKAVASVSFVPSNQNDAGGVSRVDIWIGDRVTGTTLKRTVLPGSGEEAPSVVALRALELLRSSLRAYSDNESDEIVEGAHPERASEAVRNIQAPTKSEREVFVSAEAALTWSLPHGGTSFGPQYSLGWLTGHFGGRLVGRGPLLGGSDETAEASFDAWTLSFLAEPLGAPISTSRWRLLIFPSVGATFLKINGEATGEYSGRKDQAWFLSLGGGSEATFRLSQAAALTWSARIFALVPQPVIELADESQRFGSPSLSTSLGFAFFL